MHYTLTHTHSYIHRIHLLYVYHVIYMKRKNKPNHLDDQDRRKKIVIEGDSRTRETKLKRIKKKNMERKYKPDHKHKYLEKIWQRSEKQPKNEINENMTKENEKDKRN